MGVDYAEPFVVKESLAIDDIVNMPVPPCDMATDVLS